MKKEKSLVIVSRNYTDNDVTESYDRIIGYIKNLKKENVNVYLIGDSEIYDYFIKKKFDFIRNLKDYNVCDIKESCIAEDLNNGMNEADGYDEILSGIFFNLYSSYDDLAEFLYEGMAEDLVCIDITSEENVPDMAAVASIL